MAHVLRMSRVTCSILSKYAVFSHYQRSFGSFSGIIFSRTCANGFTDYQKISFRNLSKQSLNLQSTPTPEIKSKPKLSLSDSCVARLKEISNPKDDNFLRILIDGGGCAGFQYKFDMDSTVGEDDRVFEKDGVKVVIDETSLEYIKGSTVDYHVELIRSSFRIINNPLADTGCSCGASFSIKI